MGETASYLGTIPGKTIVITGALRPERFSNSDAHVNLGVAIGALQTVREGTFIAMSGCVYPGGAVGRNTKTGQFIAASKL
jgi:L-asparaginase